MGKIFNLLGYLAAGGLCLFLMMTSGKEQGSPPPELSGMELLGSAGGGGPSNSGTGAGAGTGAGTGATPGTGTAPGTGTPTGPTGNGQFNSADAMATAGSDNAGVGYCARGVANILDAQGMGNMRGLNAHDFPSSLGSQGWTYVEGYSPTNAPEGALLVYNSDVRLGQPNRGTGGGSWGHVEVVGTNSSGNRVYISDAARSNYGGTVADNYMGAWVYTGR